MLKLIRKSLLDLRRQPVLGTISVIGTALAIYLIMMVVMIQAVKTEPFAPESNRDRFLHVKFNSFKSSNDYSNSPMGFGFIRHYLYPMETPEAVTAYAWCTETSIASVPGERTVSVDRLDTDGNFWKVFDFTFLDGKPYTQEEVESGSGYTSVVISKSLARRLFGRVDVAGERFMLNNKGVTVVGVVNDVSTLLTKSYAQVWTPLTRDATRLDANFMGDLSVTILAKNRADFPAVRSEYERAMASVSNSSDWTIELLSRPYDQWTETSEQIWANCEPDVKSTSRKNFLIYAILLLVPAINLGEMTRSRMHRRYAEIGVRRAYGASRVSIIKSIIAENFVVTILAGIIGLVLALITGFAFGSELFSTSGISSITVGSDLTVSPSVLFHWSTFGWALLCCFVLNLLSSGIPAWRASRVNIVNALIRKS